MHGAAGEEYQSVFLEMPAVEGEVLIRTAHECDAHVKAERLCEEGLEERALAESCDVEACAAETSIGDFVADA